MHKQNIANLNLYNLKNLIQSYVWPWAQFGGGQGGRVSPLFQTGGT